MSYDLELRHPGSNEVLYLAGAHYLRGGTCCLGGEPRARLNITYNYWKHFRKVLGPEGIRALYGKTGAQTIPILSAAIQQLGDDPAMDYWAATEGNARRALLHCLVLAALCPDGVWAGD